MLQLPPWPAWYSLHPLIIHFPIALLLVSPLFLLIGVVRTPLKGRPYLVAALILLLLGTASLFLSVRTGVAASELVDRTPPVEGLLLAHEALATETRNVFGTLSVIAVGVLVLPLLFGKADRLLFSRILPLSFLAFYAVGIIFLVNTADAGGRLVHEFGVHSTISPRAEQSLAPPGGAIKE